MAKKKKNFSKVNVYQPGTNNTLVNLTENKLSSQEDVKLSTEITNNENIEEMKSLEIKEGNEIFNKEIIEKLNNYNNISSQGILCQEENIKQSNIIDDNKSKLFLEKELNNEQYIIINEENLIELIKNGEENNCIDEKINRIELKEIINEEKNISNTEENIIELNEIKKEENKIEMTEIKIESEETQTSKNKSISCGRKFCSIL
jgi:hypothetical protein